MTRYAVARGPGPFFFRELLASPAPARPPPPPFPFDAAVVAAAAMSAKSRIIIVIAAGRPAAAATTTIIDRFAGDAARYSFAAVACAIGRAVRVLVASMSRAATAAEEATGGSRPKSDEGDTRADGVAES